MTMELTEVIINSSDTESVQERLRELFPHVRMERADRALIAAPLDLVRGTLKRNGVPMFYAPGVPRLALAAVEDNAPERWTAAGGFPSVAPVPEQPKVVRIDVSVINHPALHQIVYDAIRPLALAAEGGRNAMSVKVPADKENEVMAILGFFDRNSVRVVGRGGVAVSVASIEEEEV